MLLLVRKQFWAAASLVLLLLQQHTPLKGRVCGLRLPRGKEEGGLSSAAASPSHFGEVPK